MGGGYLWCTSSVGVSLLMNKYFQDHLLDKDLRKREGHNRLLVPISCLLISHFGFDEKSYKLCSIGTS
jgi:hypothetical protein